MIGIVDYNAGNIKSVERALDFLGEPYVLSKNPGDLQNADRVIFPGDGEAAYAMRELQRSGYDIFLREWAAAKKPLLGICIGAQIIFDKSEEGGSFADGRQTYTECLGLVPGTIRHLSRLWAEAAASNNFGKENISAASIHSSGPNDSAASNDFGKESVSAASCNFGNSARLGQPSNPGASNNSPLKVPHMGWNDVQHDGLCPLLKGVAPGSDFYFVHSYVIQPEDSSVIKGFADYGIKVPAVIQSGNIFACQFHPEKSGKPGLQIVKNFVSEDLRNA